MHVIALQTLMYMYFKIVNVCPSWRISALNAAIGLVKSALEVVTGRVHYSPWRMLSGSGRLRWTIWSKRSKTTRERTTKWCLEILDMVSMSINLKVCHNSFSNQYIILVHTFSFSFQLILLYESMDDFKNSKLFEYSKNNFSNFEIHA